MFYYPQQQQTQYAATPTYMLPQTQFSGQYNALKGRPVSSLEEARASAIDFDGSVFFFPDIANKRIYTKQINLDGTAMLNMYELKEIPMESHQSFVTREEFVNAINALTQRLEFNNNVKEI